MSLPPTTPRRLPSIRAQLLWAVNLSLAAAFAVVLVFEYQHELARQLTEEHGSLESDATIHSAAILRFRDHGLLYVQDYLNAVGNRPLESYARKHQHQIIVYVHGGTLLAPTGHPDPNTVIKAMMAASRAPDHRARWEGREFIVGSYTDGNQTIFVADDVANLRWWVLQDLLWQLGAILLVAVLGALVLNLLLLRLVARPLEQLVASVEQIGQGQLGLQAARLGSAELDQLVQSINLMSHSLQAEDIRHRREMSKARQIQDHLLPGRVQVPGLQIDHLYLPAAGVAGDYYDVLPLPAGASLVCIADVTGHGIPAAMTAAMLKAFLLHAIEHHDRPNEILRFLDQRFSSMALPGDFASVWLARWDPNTSQLTYSSAGHESGWLITASGVEELRSTGPVLGVFTEATWQLEQVDVHAGERLILFTDGFTEAIAPNGELLGRSHLPKLLSHCRSLDFPDVIPRLKSEFDRHLAGRAQDDDLTIVVVEFSRGMTDRAAAPMLPTAAVVGTSADSRR